MKFERLGDWLRWQESLSPKAIDLGLDRVRAVWRQLGTAPAPLVVTVAGTNGKGSCVAFIDAIARAAGFRTGVYTSPHLVRYNERVVIDGREATDEALMAAFQRVDDARGNVRLTYFEFGTLAALDLFARSDLDLAILEVGLGGRLDAVNVLDADVSLVTTIDIDHAAWLGDDRESIGREKAGVFRRDRPAVFGGDSPPDSLVNTASELGVPLWIAGRDYGFAFEGDGWRWWGGGVERHGLPRPSMRGGHQLFNAAASLAVLQRIADRLPVDQRSIREGLLKAIVRGRFEVIPGSPRRVLDVAHNPAAAAGLARNLAVFAGGGRNLAVFGALADKDVEGIVAPLAGLVDHWHLAAPDAGRALPASELERRVGAVVGARRCSLHGSVAEAVSAARAAAHEQDTVVIFGSFLVVGAAMEAAEDG